MDNSSTELLTSLNYFTILQSIFSYVVNKTDHHDKEIIDEVCKKLDYNIHKCYHYISLYKLLNDLGICIELTIDTFYLLIRPLGTVWFDSYDCALVRRDSTSSYVYITDILEFVSVFMQEYGNKHNRILRQVTNEGRFIIKNLSV